MSCMYDLKPILVSEDIVVPSCMYRLPQIQGRPQPDGSPDDRQPEVHPDGFDLAGLERRQLEVLNKLTHLKSQLDNFAKGDVFDQKSSSSGSASGIVKKTVVKAAPVKIVVHCDLQFPAMSLATILNQVINEGKKVFSSCHLHCSSPKPPSSLEWANFLPSNASSSSQSDVCVTLIWKPVGRDLWCWADGAGGQIRGEVNVARHLCRSLGLFHYDSGNLAQNLQQDQVLDQIHSSFFWAATPDLTSFLAELEELLQRHPFLSGATLSLPDVVVYSQLASKKRVLSGARSKQWLSNCQRQLVASS